MSSDDETMDGQTPSTRSEDTSLSGEEATHSPPQNEAQDMSSGMSEVSLTAHNGSISEGAVSPRVSPVDSPTQNVPESTTEDARVTSYVTERQANHSRPFEANQNTVIEDRQAEMAARLDTMMRTLEGLVDRYPATIIEATEILID
ncbi:hypothetical protein N0V85_000701 [Neurospora sp. IMI 360204]|nr:hypothetical protein N0V85_000701 [Neurospora sp. IMI 360204]